MSHTLILMSYRLRTPFGSNKSTLRGNELILHWKTAERRAKPTNFDQYLGEKCENISTAAAVFYHKEEIRGKDT